MRNYTNSVAKVIHWTGIVYSVLTIIGGFILGYAMGDVLGNLEDIFGGYSSRSNQFDLTYAITFWAIGFMFSLIFFGAAEIIELLHLQKEETTKLLAAVKINNISKSIPEVPHTNVQSFDDLPEL